MLKKTIFTVLFVFSLQGIQVASFQDWLFLTLIIQVIWVMLLSNKIIKLSKSKNKIDQFLQTFNKVFVYLLVADIFIIFLSMSFGFRILFAPLYRPTFYISGIVLLLSIFGNYYVIINDILKRPNSLTKNILLIISSFFYPIGIYSIKT